MRRRRVFVEGRRDRARRPVLLTCCALVLAGCGGGERWTPSDVGQAAAGGAAATAGGSGRVEPFAASARPAPTLQPEGEIELPEGRVERTYRVRIVNGPRALEDGVAELVGVAPGVEIVKGRIELGPMAADAVVVPPSTVTLRHATSVAIDPSSLRWRLHENATRSEGGGRLLGGEPEQLASGAVHDYRAAKPPAAVRAPRAAAVLAAHATVADVNRALREGQARIVEMRPRSRALTLRLVATDERVQQHALERLSASRAFELVRLLPTPPVDAGAADAAPERDSACDV